jgi:dUTPase
MENIIKEHRTFLIHLGSCIKLEERTQFNIHVLKSGYNYHNKEIIDFWNKVTLINKNYEK